MSYYRRERIYTNGANKSASMNDVMPWNVTIRKDVTPYFGTKQTPGNNKTVFKEISIVPPAFSRTTEMKELINARTKRQDIGKDKFCSVMFDAMKKALLEKWIPGKSHIIQHSSGWDSRLISTALIALRKERGDAWLGDVLFVEVSGEHVQFKKVMQAQGWKTNQYTVYNYDSIPNEHHMRSFGFGDAWLKLNGYCAYPVNCNYDAFEWLRERFAIPESKHCQIVTGYGANEIGNWLNAHKRGLKAYSDFIYYHSLSHFPLWGGESIWIHPFYHLDYINTFVRYGKGRHPNYREAIVQKYGKKWARITKTHKNAKRKAGYRTISKEIRMQCQDDYDISWLGRKVFPNIELKSDINYHPWWGYWSLASFCDYLLESGHTINVG